MRKEIWVDIGEAFGKDWEEVTGRSCSFCENHEGDDTHKQLPAIMKAVQMKVFSHLIKRVNELLEEKNQNYESSHKSFIRFWDLLFTETCFPTARDPLKEYEFSVRITQSTNHTEPWITTDLATTPPRSGH